MKLQVRKSVFETNSSSTHSMTIEKLDGFPDIRSIVGDSIVVGRNVEKDVFAPKGIYTIIPGMTWQDKLDYFWWSANGLARFDYVSGRDLIFVMLSIIRMFKKFGVTVAFNDDINNYKQLESDDQSVKTIVESVKDEEKFEEMFVSYLFGDVLSYIFCDECCYNRYDAINKDINEHLKHFDGKQCYTHETRI